MISFKQPQKTFPKAISFYKILGPSIILLGLGLGSGEVILWPYLVSNYGLSSCLHKITKKFYLIDSDVPIVK